MTPKRGGEPWGFSTRLGHITIFRASRAFGPHHPLFAAGAGAGAGVGAEGGAAAGGGAVVAVVVVVVVAAADGAGPVFSSGQAIRETVATTRARSEIVRMVVSEGMSADADTQGRALATMGRLLSRDPHATMTS